MNPSLNWKYLPDAITEAEIELKLKWSADLHTRRSVLRQARLRGFKTPTAYLLQIRTACRRTSKGVPTTTICLNPPPPDVPQGRFAVRILFGNKGRSLSPIGTQDAPAIDAGGGAYAALRRIVIRSYSWRNWNYPLLF